MVAAQISNVSLPLQGVTVLLVGDRAGLADGTQCLLEEEGACVAVAANGRAALDIIEAVSPDVVLCDVKMPVIDAEFPRRLRTDLRFARFARLPVIALTAFGGSTDYLRTLRDRFDGHLVKPVGAVTLGAVVEHFSRRSEARAGRSRSDRPGRRSLPVSTRKHAA